MMIRKVFVLILINLITIPISKILIAPNLPKQEKQYHLNRVKCEIDRMTKEDEFKRFADDLGFRESGNNWQIINTIGCMGKYQFSYRTLKTLKYPQITPKAFRNDPNIFPPELQYQLFTQLVRMNEMALNDYSHYVGQIVNGIVITKSGLIAGSHLGGVNGVKKFLDSNGKVNRKDKYGTSIKDYLFEFAGYDI